LALFSARFLAGPNGSGKTKVYDGLHNQKPPPSICRKRIFTMQTSTFTRILGCALALLITHGAHAVTLNFTGTDQNGNPVGLPLTYDGDYYSPSPTAFAGIARNSPFADYW